MDLRGGISFQAIPVRPSLLREDGTLHLYKRPLEEIGFLNETENSFDTQIGGRRLGTSQKAIEKMNL